MIDLIATTNFGLEAVVKRQLLNLGFKNIKTSDGKIEFSGDIDAIPRANIHLRSAERVWLKIGEFTALTFDELFEKTKALSWGDWILEDSKFTVIGKSVKSTLFSVSDCQAIVKKAVVERLKEKYNTDWFDETGAEYTIQVGILKDVVTLAIDTTGPGLHKRGYRELATEAPIKETIASALVDLSYWKRDRILFDPLCGSGTIAIEAALIAKNIPPGINRRFVSEDWTQISKDIWGKEKKAAYEGIDLSYPPCGPQGIAMPKIYASDIDEDAIKIAKENAALAGVDDCIEFSVKAIESVKLPGDFGCVITNPPYGERLLDIKQAEKVCKSLGRLMKTNSTWSAYVITSMENFESLFERTADKKRKLFNGRIKTDYYQFLGPKPPNNFTN